VAREVHPLGPAPSAGPVWLVATQTALVLVVWECAFRYRRRPRRGRGGLGDPDGPSRDDPGTLNQLRWGPTPVRYGLGFLSVAVVAFAVVLEDVSSALGRLTGPGRSGRGRGESPVAAGRSDVLGLGKGFVARGRSPREDAP
jgi:hypothetical protein